MDHLPDDTLLHACPALFGHHFDALLAPIDGPTPAGSWLRGDGVYKAIEKARKFDDASLPLGPWEHELKRADWARVIELAGTALAHQSKDLQLAAWLLEAQIHQHGFAGIALGLHLVGQLCTRYWDELYPPADGASLAHRANVLRWMNDKLPGALRQVPLAGDAGDELYGLADWERANRARHGEHERGESEGADGAALASALAGTDADACSAMARQVHEARAMLAALDDIADACFGDEAPSLGALAQVLEQAAALFESELHRRGLQHQASAPPAPAGAPPLLAAAAPATQGAGEGAIRSRADAYARLNEAAGYLLQVEPHSPVPYLVRRASEWGQLNAVELYQELFVRQGGQLNIFDMLGLGAPDDAALER
ncbi:MAG: type VI secretion system protein TssA [Pseudomonadota bacterium]